MSNQQCQSTEGRSTEGRTVSENRSIFGVKCQQCLHDTVSEKFLNGTSEYKRLYRAIEVIMEVKMNTNNQ